MNQITMKLTATALSATVVLGMLSGCAAQEAPSAVEPSVVAEEVAAETTPAVAEKEEAPSVEEETALEEEAAPEEVITPEKTPEPEEVVETTEAVVSEEMLDIDLAAVPLTGAPAISLLLLPEASGTTVYGNAKAQIDGSHTDNGYVMIKYLENTTAKLKVVVKGPSGVIYYYNLKNDGSYEVFPLSDGSGTYQFQICKNVQGSSYAVSYSTTIPVTLNDEYAPFLLPNQYVNYTADSAVVAKAEELMAGKTTELSKIQSVYNYVVSTLTYDKVRASTVTSGYLPHLDSVLAEQKGICFDYAALMTAMLRSQGIPCKLVVGYAGTAYHAWINAYSSTEGWMDSVIYFDGANWKLMDPTFASGANSSSSIMQYIGNGSNYTMKYLY